VDAALQSKKLTKVILSTDDSEIREIGISLGLDAPFLRPAELASDKSPAIDYLKHALGWFAERNEFYDAVCILQPSTPFRAKSLIDQAAKKFIQSEADSLFTAIPVPHEYNPHWVFESNRSGFLQISTGEKSIISRRQELPPAYIRDGAVYFTKTEVILKKNSIYGDKIAFFENQNDYLVNLDTLQDWEKAVKIAEILQGKLPE
jgi:N-acylneuraminate cytidylyltransferase